MIKLGSKTAIDAVIKGERSVNSEMRLKEELTFGDRSTLITEPSKDRGEVRSQKYTGQNIRQWKPAVGRNFAKTEAKTDCRNIPSF